MTIQKNIEIGMAINIAKDFLIRFGSIDTPEQFSKDLELITPIVYNSIKRIKGDLNADE